MSLDLNRIENLKRIDDEKSVGRCPACAEKGRDRKGNHLFLHESGAFRCVVDNSKEHKQDINRLAGRGRGYSASVPITPFKADPRKIRSVYKPFSTMINGGLPDR